MFVPHMQVYFSPNTTKEHVVHVSSLRRAFIDSRPTLAVSDCRNDLDALILDGFCDITLDDVYNTLSLRDF